MYNQLTREQRYAICLGIQEGKSQKAIARQINVHPSTISREISRNKNRFGHYGWTQAHDKATIRKEHLPGNKSLDENIVKDALNFLKEEDWSPKQISGVLSLRGIKISHETIYKRIRSDDSGTLRSHCRHRMKYRHHIHHLHKTKTRSIPNRVSIHDRPIDADGKRFGDWEMDLIIGKGQKSAILTLCERSKNYLMMEKLKYGKNPENVSKTVIKLLLPYKHNVLSITTDNGAEFALHQKIAKKLNTTVYFADSYSSWQKGAIENTNKLIRQYIPKGTDFSVLTDDFIHSIQLKINRRPREKLNFSSPKSEFFKLLS